MATQILKDSFYTLLHQGFPYQETTEEQGLADGPSLLRVFSDRDDALRYREAIAEYMDENYNSYAVVGLTLEELWRFASAQGSRIDLCSMPEHEWARTKETFWEPGMVKQ